MLPRADFLLRFCQEFQTHYCPHTLGFHLALTISIAQGSMGPDTNSEVSFHPAPFCFILFSAIEVSHPIGLTRISHGNSAK